MLYYRRLCTISSTKTTLKGPILTGFQPQINLGPQPGANFRNHPDDRYSLMRLETLFGTPEFDSKWALSCKPMTTKTPSNINRLKRLPSSEGSYTSAAEPVNREPMPIRTPTISPAGQSFAVAGDAGPLRELVDSRTRLEEAQRLARMGHWEYYIPDGRSVWSDQLYRILGYEPGQVEPSPEVIRQHAHPEDKEHIWNAMQRAFTEGEGFDTELRFYTVDGELRWGHARGEVFLDDAGKPLYVVGTGQDITEHKQLQAELEEAKQCLQQRAQDATREVSLATEILKQERESLKQKNIALRELLSQVDDSRQTLARQMQKNIGQIAMPLIADLEAAADESLRPKLKLLSQCLGNVVEPTVDNLQQRAPELTPRQLQICYLIANGHCCKEIAALLNNSYQTVLKQRKTIRRKLGLTGKRINLASFLKSMGLSEPPPNLSGRPAEQQNTTGNKHLPKV